MYIQVVTRSMEQLLSVGREPQYLAISPLWMMADFQLGRYLGICVFFGNNTKNLIDRSTL